MFVPTFVGVLLSGVTDVTVVVVVCKRDTHVNSVSIFILSCCSLFLFLNVVVVAVVYVVVFSSILLVFMHLSLCCRLCCCFCI